LISLRPEQRDTNFTWEEFERKINTELNDVLGNFIHRTTTFISTRYNNKIPNYKQDQPGDQGILRVLHESPKLIDEKLEHFRLKEALEQVIQLAREGNRYLNENEPWQTIKTDPSKAEQTIGIAAQIVATIAIELQPFLPNTSSEIQKSILTSQKISWKQAGQTTLGPGRGIRPMKPLFHKISA
ncbi:methionine--tRNA ligase, partial [Candidatus Bathyarchaeota archaeon]